MEQSKAETVKDQVQSIYSITQSEITNEDGTPISVADLQDLVYQEVAYLAELLGFELED
ncbi:hypothetical protein [Jeotgalibaca arthritidis]|uniref:Uncharacterized protein n=1 Tax=Jeotgalibaca arthritidis TaxID=1868794 RepID=A0A6G7KBL0_9LACT|nr:hypothetical protein [Jeotgalibaca arthritidis]QII82612.1 hypothetical protein G7057_09330 [Jeotgalibaca arthritidis]